MAIEIERKWIVDKDLFYKALQESGQKCSLEDIIQGYVASDSGVTVRVRISNGHRAVLCIKKYINSTSCEEFEYQIPVGDGEALLVGAPTVNKERIFITGKFTVDKFHGDLDGLYLAEYEGETEEEVKAFEPPEFCTKEVTGRYGYSNVMLANLLVYTEDGRFKPRRKR